MSLVSPIPSVGDIVTPVRPIKTTVIDYLLGGDAGIKPRTRGVVVDTTGWNALEVEWDHGLWGSSHTAVRTSQVRLVARGVGHERFHERAARLRWARAGVAACLILPVAYFVIFAWLHGDSQSGILVALVDRAVQGILDLLSYAIESPLRALLYVLAVGGMSRLSLGR